MTGSGVGALTGSGVGALTGSGVIAFTGSGVAGFGVGSATVFATFFFEQLNDECEDKAIW